MPETQPEIRSNFKQFIDGLNEKYPGEISHITITVHGGFQHFVPDRPIHHFAVTKMEGVAELSYQDMELDATIPNMFTIIATTKMPKQA